MSNLPRPPAHLEPYVRILGVEGAMLFFLTYGGGELYIPRNARPGARWSTCWGSRPRGRLEPLLIGCPAACRPPSPGWHG